MAVQIGQLIENCYDIRNLPDGTAVVRIGTSDVKVRGNNNHNWFTDGSKATQTGAKYVVVGLPEEKKLDLSVREDLALALRRAYLNNDELETLGWDGGPDYLRQADAVLAAFEPKKLKVGARIKVVNTDRGWAAPYQVGEYATVEIEDSSDGTWFVRFDDSSSGYWVHRDEIEVVS